MQSADRVQNADWQEKLFLFFCRQKRGNIQYMILILGNSPCLRRFFSMVPLSGSIDYY